MAKAYRPSRPRWSTYHDEWREAPHGSNSRNGAAAAVRHRCARIDNDGTRTFDDVLINDHGNPSTAYFRRGDRSIRHTWAEAQQLKYVYDKHVFHLRTIAQAMADNAKHKVHGRPLGTEVEIKFLGPISQARLEAIMVQLAEDAHAAYGADWKHYVVVKVLTCLTGGTAYALKVCTAAHAAGIPTMILARNGARFNRFTNHHEVTWVRGSAVIR